MGNHHAEEPPATRPATARVIAIQALPDVLPNGNVDGEVEFGMFLLSFGGRIGEQHVLDLSPGMEIFPDYPTQA